MPIVTGKTPAGLVAHAQKALKNYTTESYFRLTCYE